MDEMESAWEIKWNGTHFLDLLKHVIREEGNNS